MKAKTIFWNIPLSSLRELCIKQNWYTEGTDEDFYHLLFEIRSNLVKPIENLSSSVSEITDDIYSHTNFSNDCRTSVQIKNLISFMILNNAVVYGFD